MFRISIEKLCHLMQQKKIVKAAELARAAELHADTVYDMLKKPYHDCRLVTVQSLARALGGVSVEDLRWTPGPQQPTGPSVQPPPDRIDPGTSTHSFRDLIAFHTAEFHGRDFVFRGIRSFLKDRARRSGYYVIQGEPGVGKSALLAKWIDDHSDCLAFFNIAAEGLNTPREFLRHICCQLICKFELPYTALADDFDRSGFFLSMLLQEAAGRLPPGARLVIAVDALDEVKMPAEHEATNVLFLPHHLPENVYFVVTTRPYVDSRLRVADSEPFMIEASSEENLRDAASYVRARWHEAGIHAWARRNRVTKAAYVDALLHKSQGNFMYLRHVLTAMSRGQFIDDGLADLPQGLTDYYRAHWATMRRKAGAAFDDLYQPVLCLLAACSRPVSLQRLAEWTGRREGDVLRALKQWWEFLDEPTARKQKLYRLYHATFREFLEREVEPGLERYHEIITVRTLQKASGSIDAPLRDGRS